MFKVLILFFPYFALAGQYEPPKDDNLTLKYGISIPSLGFGLKANPEIANTNIEYDPNSTTDSFVSLGYRNLGVTVGVANPQSDTLIAQRGQTKLTDYQVRFYGRRYTHEFFYQKYSGFFIKNSADIDSTYSGSDNRIQRSDISVEHAGFALIKTFQDKDYSMPAAFGSSGRQTESGGSALGMLYIDNYNLSGTTPLVPSQVTSNYPELGTLKSARFLSYGLGVGYGATLTYGGVYLTALGLIGVGSQNKTIEYTNRIDSGSQGASKLSLRLGLGYNGVKHFFVSQFLLENSGYKFDKEELNITNGQLAIFYGYRFDGVSIPFLNPLSALFD